VSNGILVPERLGESTWAEDRRWRRIRPPDGGRWWQMLGNGAKFDHEKEQAIAALLSHRNVEEAARAVGISAMSPIFSPTVPAEENPEAEWTGVRNEPEPASQTELSWSGAEGTSATEPECEC
jgi:hypothetical protein